jgi:hypothetical protein
MAKNAKNFTPTTIKVSFEKTSTDSPDIDDKDKLTALFLLYIDFLERTYTNYEEVFNDVVKIQKKIWKEKGSVYDSENPLDIIVHTLS